MNKPVLVFQGPVFTRSGYGDHCRDLLRSLKTMGKYDVKIIPLRWGNTPQNQVDPTSEFGQWMLSCVIQQIQQKPDVFVQVSVANEFEPKGHYNIGVTAGVETTIIPKEFIDGSNKMDLIIVPSNFTKQNLGGTVYQQKDQATGQIVGEIKTTKPIEVLFEGVDTEIFSKGSDEDILSDVKEDFNFLIVGHWLKGNLGQDRKDIGMAIKTIATVFQYLPADKRPGIIVKTSHAGFSVIDRETTREKIQGVLEQFGDNCPSVYLIHGDLEESDMSNLYHHPKVKAMVSFTKAEGFGRPLLEFSTTGKPIIAPHYSGQADFLKKDFICALPGGLTEIHGTARNEFLIKGAKWFTPDYVYAGKMMKEVQKNYKKWQELGKRQRYFVNSTFTKTAVASVYEKVLNIVDNSSPKQLELKLPKLSKV